MADNDTPSPSDQPPAKPAPRRRATTPAKAASRTRTPRAAEPAATKTDEPKAASKPRATKRSQPATGTAPASRRSPAKPAPRKSKATKPAQGMEQNGSPWGAAAIGAGVAAIGAAAAAAFLGVRRRNPERTANDAGAHQADGTDSSGSFAAGIADEGTIPER